MNHEVVFAYPCPVCKKTLQSSVQYLGRQVNCRYCNTVLTARDPHFESAAMLQPIDQWTPIIDQKEAQGTEQSRRPR